MTRPITNFAAFILTVVAMTSPAHLQELQLDWDVRVNEGQWNAFSLEEQQQLTERFREIGLLRGDGIIIGDLHVNAIRVEGSFWGDNPDGAECLWFEMKLPDTCRTFDGGEYMAGEVREDTDQRCDCGWLRCEWVQVK